LSIIDAIQGYFEEIAANFGCCGTILALVALWFDAGSGCMQKFLNFPDSSSALLLLRTSSVGKIARLGELLGM
jgi:hypothetical protein